MRYTGIWEDQRLLWDRERIFFFLFVIPASSVPVCVCVCVEGWKAFFFLFYFLIIPFLHVHVKYIVVTSPTSSCSHKPQILYHCCCHVCLARWCFLAQPPSPHNVCCCNHLIYRLWSHKNCLWWSQSREFIMMRHDVRDGIRNHSLTNPSVAELHRLPLRLVEPAALCRLPASPDLHRAQPYSTASVLPRAKNQIWHKAA